MKVRQDPPAHPGYNGKQGGERVRTILKDPVATDMAMKASKKTNTPMSTSARIEFLFQRLLKQATLTARTTSASA